VEVVAPKQFQLDGAEFLAERIRALLADEPGVGKTAQVVIAAEQLRAGLVRIICPAVGIEHWRREFRRWWKGPKLPSLEIMSFDQARAQSRALRTGQIVPWRADVLVLDECHYAKNPDAARTLAVFGKGGFGWYAHRIWSLSGTPAPNNVAELWPMLRAYGATGLDYEGFKRYFCIVDALGKVRGSNPERMKELRAILKPFTLRRKKIDVLPELGAIDIQPWYVEPNAALIQSDGFEHTDVEQAVKKEEAALRKAIKTLSPEELLAFLAGHQHEFATLRRYNAMLKAPAVYDQVRFEIDAGLLDKVVIYGYHKEPLEVLRSEFFKVGIGAAVINGATPQKDRDKLVQWWKHPKGPRVMLASIIAAGVVLDFTEAHQGIMLELDWVPGNNLQAMQRMHRIGQKYPVSIRVANSSPIDEVINDVVARKTKELSAVFD
jgi:SWI/SNF-related matrix-associated actin-dependent regulator 1 of chromatin subfamily A